ncbi:MAG TPA: vitamin B12 dependent-methionine synthase activation domain-containing protein [Prolixibacteraceae bacterium]
MMREYSFKYSDLSVDLKNLHKVLGFPDEPLPAPFDDYLAEALDFASQLTEIRASWVLAENVHIDFTRGCIHVGDKTFLVGKTVCKELRGSEKLIFFVCTAGHSLSKKSHDLLKGEDPAKGYFYDQVGTFVVEAAGDKMQSLVREEFLINGECITNRYSPGYCHWSVADQHLLFSLFPSTPCGVTLTESALMNPVKSISGLIGIGSEVKFRDYPCTLCLNLNCIYRRVAS